MLLIHNSITKMKSRILLVSIEFITGTATVESHNVAS